MLVFFYILLFALVSCSTPSLEQKLVALEDWKGRSTKELMAHPYFGSLPVIKKEHDLDRVSWIFRDQTRFQTSAYCDSLGGCMGMPTYNCDTAFSIQDDHIQAVEQNGTCPPLKTTEALKK